MQVETLLTRTSSNGRAFFSIIALTVLPVMWAEGQPDVDFAELIKTPGDLQRTLEHCDGHPAFETAFANWLETAQPRSPADRDGIRKASLRLLEDTTDRQLVLGLIDGLLRHALEDVKADPALVPGTLARSLYLDIGRRRKSKATEIALLAYSLAEDGAVTDERQASFIEEFLNRVEPRAPHHIELQTGRNAPTAADRQPLAAKRSVISAKKSSSLRP
jgi:hypothetical protein